MLLSKELCLEKHQILRDSINFEINNENIKEIFNKLSKLFYSFFPGILILELFFQIGIFSNHLGNLFDFILYLVWCGIISIPFHYDLPNEILLLQLEINKELSKRYPKKNNKRINFFKEELDDKNFLEFILIKLLIFVILFYISNIINDWSFYYIPSKFVQLIIVFISSQSICYLISKPYSKFKTFSVLRTAKKMSEKITVINNPK